MSASVSVRPWRGCVFIGVSLDGFIARLGGDLRWLTEPQPADHAAVTSSTPALEWDSFLPTVDALVMGRSTYETVTGFDEWPFAGKRVFVLSTSLDEADDRIEVVRTPQAAAERLTEVGSRRVYVDGGQAIRAFLSADLIDEITVSVAPILIGSGRPLFSDLGHDVRLRLRGTHALADTGMVAITYDVVH